MNDEDARKCRNILIICQFVMCVNAAVGKVGGGTLDSLLLIAIHPGTHVRLLFSVGRI